MNLLDSLVEKRVAEAQEQGAFDNLPGSGKPLSLSDDQLLPSELRTAYRILKNAGYLPPEVKTRRQIAEIEDLLRGISIDDRRYHEGARRLNCLRATLEAQGAKLHLAAPYAAAVCGRFDLSDT